MDERSWVDTDVVIIGAGASGLAAIKQLTTTTDLQVVCFEARDGPAGVWRIPSSNESTKRSVGVQVGFDGLGRPVVEPAPLDTSPMYAGLRTNVQKELMAFRGQPFPTDGAHPAAQFPAAHQVAQYLLDAARGLEAFIRFNHQVLRVAHHLPRSPSDLPNPHASRRRWALHVLPLTHHLHQQNSILNVSCDFVLAASGHYSVPYIPFIPSLWTWPKGITHSCIYSSPTDAIFQDKVRGLIGTI